MAVIPFGEWTPDQPDLKAAATVVKNVVPSLQSYRPVRALATVSGAADSRIIGMGGGEDNASNAYSFVADAAKIYRYQNAALTSVSKSGNYTTGSDERWIFTAFGNRMVASNYSQAMQSYVMGTSSLFADLNASAPRCRAMATVRDFLVTGNVYDSGDYPNRVRWSALGDPTNWTIGTSTQSDFQDLFEGGQIRAIAGGEYGLVFLKRAIYRMSYVGAPLIFQFDQVAANRGLVARDAWARIGGLTFFLDRDGFYVFDGQGVSPIGAEKIDRFFWGDVSESYIDRITCSFDPDNQTVFWSYPSIASTDGTPDKIMAYSWQLQRWSLIEQDHQMIGRTLSTGYTLEQLDTLNSNIESHTTSFDSTVYQGGNMNLSAAVDNRLASFSGANLAATLETPEAELGEARRSMVRSVRPVVDGGTLTVQIASRDNVADTVSYGAAATQNTAGICPFRSEGRYHRARLNVAGGGSWTHAEGIEMDAVPGGLR